MTTIVAAARPKASSSPFQGAFSKASPPIRPSSALYALHAVTPIPSATAKRPYA